MVYVVVSRIELPLPLSARDGQAENLQSERYSQQISLLLWMQRCQPSIATLYIYLSYNVK